ncbi:tetratricopeptide repeat protein [Algoriphagus sanaruensis]|uniref:Peptidase n=1 Tax=Algoriphagus sanaruensis TaxID=1727163 RepID=A0A142EJ27_9BACT|nr:tetratricopeptide repeat protein [Algoriphagus sanaruensis]AMQ55132.1 peptidase [Algoriphagus sanaruensis]
MKGSQLVLIGLGLAAIVGLYALPKVVVDNDPQNAAIEDTQSEDANADASMLHKNELSSDQKSIAEQLKAKLSDQNSTDAEKTGFAKELSEIYKSEGIFDSAAFYLKEALLINPTDLSLIEQTGNAYYEAYTFALDKEKVEDLANKTREYLGKILEGDASRLDLKTKIAMTYVSSSNPMQGITMLREVLDQDPTNEDGLFNMGVLSLQSGQYDRASERFEELVKYHPENLQGQFYLGVSYFESKEKNKAKAQFELVRSMTQDPMILESIRTYLEKL